MASVSDCGADLRKSRLGIVVEHAASMKPPAMTAMTRLMIPPPGRRRTASPQNTPKAVLVIDSRLHLTHFLIVGAGAAGLMAARELARSGQKGDHPRGARPMRWTYLPARRNLDIRRKVAPSSSMARRL